MIFQPRPKFFGASNRIEAFRRLCDQQGCHICTTGLPDCHFSRYFTTFCITLVLIDLEACFFKHRPMFLEAWNQMEALRKNMNKSVARFVHQLPVFTMFKNSHYKSAVDRKKEISAIVAYMVFVLNNLNEQLI